MPSHNRPAPRRGFSPPRGVARVLQVVRAVAQAGAPVSLATLAQQVGIPRTTLFATLKALVQDGYLEFDGDSYGLGAETYKLGQAIAQRAEFPQCALPVLQRLARDSGETVILSALADDRQHVVYVTVIEAQSPLRFSVKAGTQWPLSASASGHAILSHMPAAERAAYIAQGRFKKFTPNTVGTATALRKVVAAVRRQHWAMTIDGTVLGAVGIAAPWFHRDGTIGGAVNVAAPTARILERREACAEAVRHAGEAISRVLGYHGPYPPP